MATTTTTSPLYDGPERRQPLGGGRSTRGSRDGMDSRIKLFGHPVHQQLVALPIGLLAASVLFDLVYLGTDNPAFANVAFWMLVSGVVTALAAAPFGYIDWLAIPEKTRAKRIGTMHAMGNMVVLLLFGLSLLVRINDAMTPPRMAIWMSVLAVPVALLAAWLGGELVTRLGVGVSTEAGLDAGNSIGAVHRRH